MTEPLTIAAVQPLSRRTTSPATRVTHAITVRTAGTRVVLFPELSPTGYELDAPAIAADDQLHGQKVRVDPAEPAFLAPLLHAALRVPINVVGSGRSRFGLRRPILFPPCNQDNTPTIVRVK